MPEDDEVLSISVEAVDRASDAFQAIAKSSNDLFASLSNLINPMTLLSGVIGAGLVAALKEAVDSFEDFALRVRDLAYESGGTVDQVTQLVNGLDMVGVSSDQVQRMLSQMARQVEAGSTAFQQLGVNIQVGADTQASTLSIFLQTINALGQMTDTTQRDALARQLWGRTWMDMVPVLQMGSEALMALGAASARAMTPDDIERAHQYHIQMTLLQQDFQAIVVEVGSGIAPVLTDLARTWGPAAYAAWLPVKGVFQEILATVYLMAAGVNAIGSAAAHITDALGLTSGQAQFWDRLTTGAWNQAQSWSSSGLGNILADVTGGYTAATGAASQYGAAVAGTVPGAPSPAVQQLQSQLTDLINKYYAVYEAASSTSPEERLNATLEALDAERDKALTDAAAKFKSIAGTSAEDIGQLEININEATEAKKAEARRKYAEDKEKSDRAVIDATEKLGDDDVVFQELTQQQITDAWNEGAQQRIMADSKTYQAVHDAMEGHVDSFEEAYALQAQTVQVAQQDIIGSYQTGFAQIASLYTADSAAYSDALNTELASLQAQLASGQISLQTYYAVRLQIYQPALNKEVQAVADAELAKRGYYMQTQDVQTAGEARAFQELKKDYDSDVQAAIAANLLKAGLYQDDQSKQLAIAAGTYTAIQQSRQDDLQHQATVLLAQAQQNNDFWADMQSGALLAYNKLGDFWTNMRNGFESCFMDVQQLGSSVLFDWMTGQINNLGQAFQRFEQSVLKTFSDIVSDEVTRQFLSLFGLTPGSTGGILSGITSLMGGQSGTGLLDMAKSLYNVASGTQSLAQMPGIIGALAQGDIGTALEDVMPLYGVVSKLATAAGLGPAGGFAPGTFFGLFPSQAITGLVAAPAEDVLGGMAAAAAPAAAAAIAPTAEELAAAELYGTTTAAAAAPAAAAALAPTAEELAAAELYGTTTAGLGATLGGIAAAAAPFAAGAAVMALPLIIAQLLGGGSAKIDARNVGYARQAAAYIEAHPDIVPTLQAALMGYDTSAHPVPAGSMAAGGSSDSTLIPGIPDYGVLLAFESTAPGEAIGGGPPNAFATALGLSDAVNQAVKNMYIEKMEESLGGGVFASIPGGNPYAPGVTTAQLMAAVASYNPPMGGLQSGGPVQAGVPYIVGERGPELFVPSSSGQVLSHGDTSNALQAGGAAGGAIIVNLSVNVQVQVRGNIYGGSGEQEFARKICAPLVKEITSAPVIGQLAQALNRYARQVITVRMTNGGIFNPRKAGT